MVNKKIYVVAIVLLVFFVVGSAWAIRISCPVCDGSKTETCSECDGDGYIIHDSRFYAGCSNCGGSGTKNIANGSTYNYREGKGKVPCGACDGKGWQELE